MTALSTYERRVRNRDAQREWRASVKNGTAEGWTPDPNFKRHPAFQPLRIPRPAANPLSVQSANDSAVFVVVVPQKCRACGAVNYSGRCSLPHPEAS